MNDNTFKGLRHYIDIISEGPELRTQAQIDASKDMLSANDGSGANGGAAQARNPNAGLTPDDPRWQGPKPAAAPAPNAAAVAGVTPKPQIPAAPAPAAAPAGATASGSANPWEGKDPAKAAAWSKLTPEDQKWLGGADPTDTIILQRAPKKGAAAAAPAAPAAPAAAPAQSPEQLAAAQKANGVDPATGQNVTMPDGTNPETGEKTGAVTQAAKPAAGNFDTMPFGQAFKAAQAQGLTQFTWKGKPYAVQTAKPQAAKPAAAKPAPQMNNPGTTTPQGMDISQMSAESTGYSEDQTLARIVELARR